MLARALGLGGRLLAHDYVVPSSQPERTREEPRRHLQQLGLLPACRRRGEEVLGSVPSHVLLDSDNKNDLLPSGLTA